MHCVKVTLNLNDKCLDVDSSPHISLLRVMRARNLLRSPLG